MQYEPTATEEYEGVKALLRQFTLSVRQGKLLPMFVLPGQLSTQIAFLNSPGVLR